MTDLKQLRWPGALDILATMMMMAAAVAIITSSLHGARVSDAPARLAARVEPPLPTVPVSVKGAMTKGDLRAKVVIIEFSDFQCSYCGRFVRDVLPSLEQGYINPGHVRLVFMHDPLPIHAQAEKAAEASICAARQGKGWEMHDALFGDQEHLDEGSVKQRAARLGLDRLRFATCLGTDAASEVQGNVNQARTLQVTGTPGFLIGTLTEGGDVKVAKRLTGAQPIAAFARVLDPLVAAAGR